MILRILLGSFPLISLQAGYCPARFWTLNEIARAPVLALGRVESLRMENGPHFTGDPRKQPQPQQMTAKVKVFRSTGEPLPQSITLHFVGRDGPDFAFCPTPLPELLPGQVLMLPLQSNLELLGADGMGMTMRVAAAMEEPAPAAGDSRSFIIRELVNSFRRADAMAAFTAASLLVRQDAYVEPEFSAQLERSIGNDNERWAHVLGDFLLADPNHGLRQLALRHLPASEAGMMARHAILSDLSAFTDEPYHPLFSYNPTNAMGAARIYLAKYRDDPDLLNAVKLALREDRPGSSSLAARLVFEGQKACLPEALRRAMKVLHRPFADGEDLTSSLSLILQYGSPALRGQLAALLPEFEGTNPDYAAYLQKQLQATHTAKLQ